MLFLQNRFRQRITQSRKGFTLIEIMIVVLIIGILLAIAVPNFIQARDSSRTKSCIANLKQIDGAKHQYAMDNNLSGTASVTGANLLGTYIKGSAMPACPAGGTYTIGTVDTDPTCTITGHTLP
ncbi:MAG: prepilin-type N-terminal cleavage/methylation domain-containing protein [Armatimonadetes bacterium]|nr:prepilin-type N-terminal cleavage/methylation domain-containing protein [Armatimonadota bacterium]